MRDGLVTLRAGDLCVIVRGHRWSPLDECLFSKYVGRTVVLLRLCTCGSEVHWKVSGSLCVEFSCLRKIPPDELPDYSTSEELLTI